MSAALSCLLFPSAVSVRSMLRKTVNFSPPIRRTDELLGCKKFLANRSKYRRQISIEVKANENPPNPAQCSVAVRVLCHSHLDDKWRNFLSRQSV